MLIWYILCTFVNILNIIHLLWSLNFNYLNYRKYKKNRNDHSMQVNVLMDENQKSSIEMEWCIY